MQFHRNQEVMSSINTVQSLPRQGPPITISAFSHSSEKVEEDFNPSERHDCEESKSSQTCNDEVREPQIYGDAPPHEMNL